MNTASKISRVAALLAITMACVCAFARSKYEIQIPGTLGYDVSFIRLIPQPNGRNIHFVTNRKITFGEAYTDSQSQSFDLTAGELDLNNQDKSKSAGILYPACQFTTNKDGELQIELNQNACA